MPKLKIPKLKLPRLRSPLVPEGSIPQQDRLGAGVSLPLLEQIALAKKEKPLYMPIPPKAVRDAEQTYGYGSEQHIATLNKAREVLGLYIQGKDYPEIDYRPLLEDRVMAWQGRVREIGVGGNRGGSKSWTGIKFLICGNYHEPDYLHDPATNRTIPLLVNQSYIHHPAYMAVCIRKNDKDLKQWIDEAHSVYQHVGGYCIDGIWRGVEWQEGKRRFYWRHSGASIYTGHLADPNSYRHYIGMSITRIVIEELIQLDDEKPYRELMASLRSKFAELRPQIYVSFNPIGGPGVQWVFDRFIEPKRTLPDGRKIPIMDANGDPLKVYDHSWMPIYPEPLITEQVDVNIYKRLGIPIPPIEEQTQSRIFLPSKLTDNPFLMQNYEYVNQLASMTKEETDAYLFGIWTLGGAMFSDWRPKGPLPGEPANANHVIPAYPKPAIIIRRPTPKQLSPVGNIITIPPPPEFEDLSYPSVKLEPWWPRWMGGDWGFEHEAAFGWACHNPSTKQIQVYREKIFVQTVAEVVGAEIARECIGDLNSMPSHSMTLWMGWDPSASERVGGERTLFQYLASGIQRILGPNSVHIPDLIIKKLEEDAYNRSTEVSKETIAAIRNQRHAGITIRRAFDARVVGWQVCRSFLRFTPIMLDTYADFDPQQAVQVLYEGGPDKYREYIGHCSKRNVEIVPKVQLWDCCPRIMDAIPKAQRDDKNQEDVSKRHVQGVSDILDMFRYLLTAYREEEGYEPEEAYVERKMQILFDLPTSSNYSTNDLIRIRQQYEKEHQANAPPQTLRVHHASQHARLQSRQVVQRILFPGTGGSGI